MTATGRTIEASIVSLDDELPAQKARIDAECARIATKLGADCALVARILQEFKRSKKRTVRARDDFYATPGWAVRAILSHLPPVMPGARVLDAGSGSGAIAAAVQAYYPRAEIIGVEKHADLIAQARARELYGAEFVQADFLRAGEFDIPRQEAPSHVIMNPPFSRAQEFIEKALAIVKRGGTVAALLRVGFFASAKRAEFFYKHPCSQFQLARRPSFRDDGKTDASDYAWFVWDANPGRLVRLNDEPTSSKRRTAGKAH